MFASIFDRFRVGFGVVLGCQMCPWGWGKGGRIAPLAGPSRSWDRLSSFLVASCGSDSLFEPSWPPLGVVLGRFWPRFRPSWADLGSCSGTRSGILEPSTSLLAVSGSLVTFRFSLGRFRFSIVRSCTSARPCGLRAARLNNPWGPPPPKTPPPVEL